LPRRKEGEIRCSSFSDVKGRDAEKRLKLTVSENIEGNEYTVIFL